MCTTTADPTACCAFSHKLVGARSACHSLEPVPTTHRKGPSLPLCVLIAALLPYHIESLGPYHIQGTCLYTSIQHTSSIKLHNLVDVVAAACK